MNMTETETSRVRTAKLIFPLRKLRRWWLNEYWGDLRLWVLTMTGYVPSHKSAIRFTGSPESSCRKRVPSIGAPASFLPRTLPLANIRPLETTVFLTLGTRSGLAHP